VHYYHKDGTVCVNALKNTEDACTIMHDYTGDETHRHLFHEKSYEPSTPCDHTISKSFGYQYLWWARSAVPADMSSRIVNNENNKILISMLEAFISGEIDKATKLYRENSFIHGATSLYNELYAEYEATLKKQEALLKDQYGIYHFAIPIERRDPLFTQLLGQERQQLRNNTCQLNAFNDYLITRNHAKNTLHNLWHIPTSVSPTVHYALYELLDTHTPESRIDKIYEFSQNSQLTDSQKQEIIQALHLSNGVIKDFASYDRAKKLNLPAIILLPEHAYMRKILNYLVYTEQTGKDEVIRQASANTIERVQTFLRQGNERGLKLLLCGGHDIEKGATGTGALGGPFFRRTNQ